MLGRALSLSLLLVLGCESRERTAQAPAPTGPPTTTSGVQLGAGQLDPEPYRREIEAVEALLYGRVELSEPDWRGLSRAFLELHNQLVFRDTSLPAREAGRRVFFLSAHVDAGNDGPHGENELGVVRRLWEQLCAERFPSVDWIHGSLRAHSGADPVRAE